MDDTHGARSLNSIKSPAQKHWFIQLTDEPTNKTKMEKLSRKIDETAHRERVFDLLCRELLAEESCLRGTKTPYLVYNYCTTPYYLCTRARVAHTPKKAITNNH